jgi:hypothetical protein
MNQEIEAIIKRNKRVERDKAWETSITRRIIIALMTYLIIVLFLWIINLPKPWLNALVPAMAFFISTLSLSFFKRIWIKNTYKK